MEEEKKYTWKELKEEAMKYRYCVICKLKCKPTMEDSIWTVEEGWFHIHCLMKHN